MKSGKILASYIETTMLNPAARKEDIIMLCHNALKHRFVGVCVQPYYISLAASLLSGSTTKVVTVVGFPLGANEYRTKAREAELAVQSGAAEVDMVINLAALKNREQEVIVRETAAVVASGAIIKVIIETGYLNKDEIKTACSWIVEGGTHFVKTCSGFGPRGVTLDDILLLRSCLPPDTGIKAAAGIKTASFANALIEAGANRIGTSAAEKIMEQAHNVENKII